MTTSNNYTMVLVNSTTKQIYTLNLTDISSIDIYYQFEFEMPEDAPEGEYNYYLFYNPLDYKINYSNDILDSSIIVNGIPSIPFHLIQPETGILKYIKNNVKEYNKFDQKIGFVIYDKQ